MKHFLIFTILFISFHADAQPYWQQRVDTKIDVRLDDKNNILSAYEEMTYTNNSPDTLKFIYIHLWPNAYKTDQTPFARQEDRNGKTGFYYSKPKDRGYIDSLQFTVDGYTAEHYCTEDAPDIARLDLPLPLLPKHSIKIATPFKVKIPTVFSRLGHTGQAYFMSQWFPKPAVYDHKGWHPISYLDQGEFFSEYGSYDVFITLPKNYILMATGNCMDEKENNWLDKLSKDSLPSDTLYKNGWFPSSSEEMKTVHYHEDNIHDFAWFADKRWVVMKDTVYSPGNDQLVTCWSAFLPAYKKHWSHSNYYLKETIRNYGKRVGPYPYKTVKAVLGDMHAGGGMEYPTITIIDNGSSGDLKTVVVHEAGHNWFYGMLGSMERDHAWMDEGINTFYEKKTTDAFDDYGPAQKVNTHSLNVRLKGFNEELLYYEFATTHNDQAIEQTSDNFTSINYGVDVYYKTALMLRWLEHYMDSANFEKGMKDYFNTWQYRHSYPEDFKACMQRHTFKNIDWFFDPGLTSGTPIDFKITKVHVSDNNVIITVKNKTGINMPVLVDAYKNDSLVGAVWSSPFEHTTTLSLPTPVWTSLKIDGVIPDCKTANNEYRRHALFHDFGLKVKPFFGLNRADYDKLFVAPAFGYNQYNGFMAGLLFHNITMPENRFRFLLAPMYGFNSSDLAGAGSVGYQWYPGNLFKDILLQTDAKSFSYNYANPEIRNTKFLTFQKIAPSVNFTFNEHDPLSAISRTMTIKGYYISEQNSVPSPDSSKWTAKTQQKIYGLLFYNHANKRTYNPYSYNVQGQIGADFAKINLEGNLRIDYNARYKSLYIRAYFGKFFAINNDPAITSRYDLNASYCGINDYLYDGTYLARSAQNTNAGHQISIQEGGFKIPVYGQAATSDNWMATLNLKTDLPKIKYPIRLFFDAGLIPNASPGFTHPGSTSLLYDGGVEVQLIKNIMSVYIPVIMSSDFDNYLTNTYGHKNVFARSLSFTMMFQNINWLKSPLKTLKLG